MPVGFKLLWRSFGILTSALVLGFGGLDARALIPLDYAVPTSARIQTLPPQITLSWPADVDSRAWNICRKSINDSSWGNPIAILPPDVTTFTDTNVIAGAAYEYQIEEPTDYFPYPNGDVSQWKTAYGYIYAGIQAPLIEDRGKIILVLDNTHTANLANELTRFQQDLVGDGWQVLRHEVSPFDGVTSVKALIKADYDADPLNVKAVFLFGHVPVPYSGDLNPDGHADHLGAWPADEYYGEMTSAWTDAAVNDTGAQDARNYNVPGDGKFDQSGIPADLKLQVGRVDMYDLPAFLPKTEEDLLRQYLNKDHNFRQGNLNIPRRGLLCDNFGELDGEAPAASAWRNFDPLFGPSATTEISPGAYFSTLDSQGYLWSYGCGPGGPNFAQGIGDASDFAATDTQTVFTMLFGSYFADWDQTDDFLRASLGTPTYNLTCAWVGFPHWYFHHMAMGQTIGYSTLLSQNNAAAGLYKSYINAAARQVHMALMGDPTLRMHPVSPPSSVINIASNSVTLSWVASRDTVQGYHVYRSTNAAGPYIRLTGSPVSETTYTDSNGASGSYAYMVRAIKLETSGSGTYFNPSQGAFLIGGAGTIKITDISDVNGQIKLTLQGNAGLVGIDSSTNLIDWVPLATLTNTAGVIRYTNQSGSSNRRFYRALPR
jgi:hypothetical protein